MSKRAGTVVTIDDLVDADRGRRRALRAGPLHHRLAASTSTSTCWAKQANDNPVFYVQYAHARIGLDRCATRPTSGSPRAAPTSTRRCSPTRRRASCSRALAEFPRVVAAAAELREPHRVARYLEELGRRRTTACTTAAGCCRMGDEEPGDLHRARLVLVDATRIGAGQRPRPARGLGPRADVGPRHACARGRVGPRAWSRCGARRGCASPTTSTRWCRSSGRRPREGRRRPARSAGSG